MSAGSTIVTMHEPYQTLNWIMCGKQTRLTVSCRRAQQMQYHDYALIWPQTLPYGVKPRRSPPTQIMKFHWSRHVDEH
jgi:hypothetical protein